MVNLLPQQDRILEMRELRIPNLQLRDGIPRVALLIETSRSFGRGILEGVIQYTHLYTPWHLFHLPGDMIQTLPDMKEWGGNGIIARITNDLIERTILATGLPVVGVTLTDEQRRLSSPCARFSEVRADSYSAGKMAADYFLEKRFENFAFVGEIRHENWSEQRGQGFADHLAESGKTCFRYTAVTKSHKQWGKEVDRLGKWLNMLPKPIALLAALDIRGRQVISVCGECGIRVPDEVAVLGIDNDELICGTCQPPMSSIHLDARQGGFQAAEMLDAMMTGKMKTPKCFYVPATRVVERQSTDILMVSDKIVVEAVRYIIANAIYSINVANVTEHMLLSRKTLENHFKRTLHCTVLDVINRERIKRIKLLLTETNMSIQEIADKCHFEDASNLCKFFRRECRMTMKTYRRQWQQQRYEEKNSNAPFVE